MALAHFELNKVLGWFLPIAEKLAHVCLGVIEIQPSPFNLIYGSLGAGSEKLSRQMPAWKNLYVSVFNFSALLMDLPVYVSLQIEKKVG